MKITKGMYACVRKRIPAQTHAQTTRTLTYTAYMSKRVHPIPLLHARTHKHTKHTQHTRARARTHTLTQRYWPWPP